MTSKMSVTSEEPCVARRKRNDHLIIRQHTKHIASTSVCDQQSRLEELENFSQEVNTTHGHKLRYYFLENYMQSRVSKYQPSGVESIISEASAIPKEPCVAIERKKWSLESKTKQKRLYMYSLLRS